MYAPASHPSASGGPQHAYAPYQPTYPYTSQSPTALSYPNYSQPTWRSDGLELDRAEEMRKAAPKGSPRGSKHYGESVKRHLDIFDLETSLNEVNFPKKVCFYHSTNIYRLPRAAAVP